LTAEASSRADHCRDVEGLTSFLIHFSASRQVMKQSRRSSFVALAAATAAACGPLGLVGSSIACGRPAPIYSFETLYNNSGTIDVLGTRPDDFHGNGGGITITQDTIGATDQTHSMKINMVGGAFFSGAQSEVVPPSINDAATTALSFDLTVPVGGTFAGAFARLGVFEFGTENASTSNDSVQCIGAAERNISLDPGTYHLTVPLIARTNPADPEFPQEVPYATVFGPGTTQLTPTSFEFFINKSTDAPIIVYTDNVQVVTTPVSVWNSDSSGTWSDAGKWNGLPGSGNNTNVVPSGVDALALLDSVSVQDPRTVTVTSPVLIGSMEFNGGGTFTVDGTSTLTLDVSSGQSSIDVYKGKEKKKKKNKR